jgi:hypothetical protein
MSPCCLVDKWGTFRKNLLLSRGSVVGSGTMLQAGRSRVRIPMSLDFFISPNPSSRTMVRGWTQPVTEMSTRNLPRGNGQAAGT